MCHYSSSRIFVICASLLAIQYIYIFQENVITSILFANDFSSYIFEQI